MHSGASVATAANGSATLVGDTATSAVATPTMPTHAEASPGLMAGLEARLGARRLDVAISLGFVVLALFLYFWRIEEPWNGNRGYIYDEVYHAFTAAQYVNGNTDAWVWWTSSPVEGTAYEWTHPPLGKEIIAAGIWMFGDDRFGWRFTSAIVGAIGIGMIYWLGLVLTRRRVAAILAAILTLADGLYFVESRSSLLDIYGAVFMVGGFIAFYAYLAAPANKVRWPLLGMGLGLGLAIATKWNAVYASAIIGLVIVLRGMYVLARMITARRQIPAWPFPVAGLVALAVANYFARSYGTDLRVGSTGLIILLFGAFTFLVWQGNQQDASEEEQLLNRQGFIEHLIWVPLGMAVLPAAIYMLSYGPFFGAGFTLGQFKELQYQMWYYHSHLKATHQYQSTWWQWPLTQRPVWYGVQYFDNGIVGNTYANGNPLLYWSFFGAVPYALILWWQREKYRQMLVLSIGFFGQWLPWALVPRIAYAYHFLPAAIFGILAVAVTIDDLWYLGERQKQDDRVPLWPYAALGVIAILLGVGLAWGKDETFKLVLSIMLGVIFAAVGLAATQGGQRFRSLGLTNWKYIAIIYTAIIVAAFVFFYPIYSNWALAKVEVDARMWISSWR